MQSSLPIHGLGLQGRKDSAKMCGIRGVGESFVSPIDGVRTLIGLEQARSSQKLPRLFALWAEIDYPAIDMGRYYETCRM